MKTPYDTAMRVRQREIDDVRLEISVQVSQLVQIETRHMTIEATLDRETRIAASDSVLSAHAYVERIRRQRAQLAADRANADARLGQLRAKAVAAYGAFKAIESASDSFRNDAIRTIANAEQSHLDDLATAAFVRGLRKRAS
jgi:phage terminase small subunit